MKVTSTHYLLVGVFLAVMLPFELFRAPLADALGTTPKIVSGAGIASATLIGVGLLALRARQTQKERWVVKPSHRTFGLTILVLSGGYFLFREEIAEALRWSIRFGDALAVFLGVVAVSWLRRHLPPPPGISGSDGHKSRS